MSVAGARSVGAGVSAVPGASLAAAAAAGGGGARDEMDGVWAAYEAKIAAHRAYEAAGVDIQPVPGLTVKCFLQVKRKGKANASANASANAAPAPSAVASMAGAGAGAGGGDADLEALLRTATSVEATQTVTSAQGVEAVPAASVPADARVKLFINLCSSKVSARARVRARCYALCSPLPLLCCVARQCVCVPQRCVLIRCASRWSLRDARAVHPRARGAVRRCEGDCHCDGGDDQSRCCRRRGRRRRWWWRWRR